MTSISGVSRVQNVANNLRNQFVLAANSSVSDVALYNNVNEVPMHSSVVNKSSYQTTFQSFFNPCPTGETNNNYSNSRDTHLRLDVSNVMRAYGTCNPSEESIILAENILKHELGAFVYLNDSIATRIKSKSIDLKESVYVLRHEKSRLMRLFKYLALKDQVEKPDSGKSNFIGQLKQAFRHLEDSGEMEQMLDKCIESMKSEVTSDVPNGEVEYLTYVKADSLSFARKLNNFHQWVEDHLFSKSHISQNFIEVLSFLTYELLVQLIYHASLIRKEKSNAVQWNPIERLCGIRVANPDTCMSAPDYQKQKCRQSEECYNIVEILVQAGELEAKRMKVQSNGWSPSELSLYGTITPDDVRDAYLHLRSYKTRVDILESQENLSLL